MGYAVKISFCTTCMGRAHHLRETLPANLANNSDVDTEFVVLNYNSKDDLAEWMRKFLATNPLASRVAYFHERTAKFFDPRHAKNVAHLLATGDVLVNMDADNFTGPGYAAKLAGMFSENPNVCVTSDFKASSLTGKIALSKENFLRLRGYDESFTGWGAEDPDLVLRFDRSVVKSVRVKWPGEGAIKHSNEERVRNFEMGGKDHFQTNKVNWERAKSRPSTEPINKSGFGKASVYVGFTDLVRCVGVGQLA